MKSVILPTLSINRKVNVSSPHYRRILLKLSGEALKGKEPFGVDPDLLHDLVGDVAELHAMGVQICGYWTAATSTQVLLRRKASLAQS